MLMSADSLIFPTFQIRFSHSPIFRKFTMTYVPKPNELKLLSTFLEYVCKTQNKCIETQLKQSTVGSVTDL